MKVIGDLEPRNYFLREHLLKNLIHLFHGHVLPPGVQMDKVAGFISQRVEVPSSKIIMQIHGIYSELPEPLD